MPRRGFRKPPADPVVMTDFKYNNQKSQKKGTKMQKEELAVLLSRIFRKDIIQDTDEYYVDVSVEDPLGGKTTYRYRAMANEQVQIEKRSEEMSGSTVTRTLREVVWLSCGLEQICAAYRKSYEGWKKKNNDIPYIETTINDEANGEPTRSYDFMRHFWAEEMAGEENNKNLRLLLAEYGMGKSSYCQGIRDLAAEEVKEPFLSGNVSFPFVFDLNEFRTGDFDKFIETELFDKYDLPMAFQTFENLCQYGIFMVVLDAWDQMRSAREIFPISQDLNQMSSLWEKHGKALITCRRSFYQQLLKGKKNTDGSLSKDVGLYKLMGFDRDSVAQYLQYDSEQRRAEKEKPLMENVEAWVRESWRVNSELLAKPLNLRLLLKHFDILAEQIDFTKEKADTAIFLEVILKDWKGRNDVTEDTFLKRLVSQTLSSGLNRSIPLQRFRDDCSRKDWPKILESLLDFDFIEINPGKERIEFGLAAFQEFLWSHYALEELRTEPDKLENSDALIRNYLLIREVREWICKELSDSVSDCLVRQLDYVKYKKKEDVGYRGSNALTLLCDLNRIGDYKRQFDDIKSSLRRSPLMGADFRGMDLSSADFYGSNLEGADFSYTKLDGADFTGADLAQTIWREHGRLKKCAFLVQKEALCVVAGTKNGGVLTYNIDDGEQEVVDIQNDVINDLAGDRGGIYTASSDGWIGYIDTDGNLRNAYIAQSGLQSITDTNNESRIYVGADNQGIYRYDWHSGSKWQIEVDRLLGDGTGRITDIRYYSDSGKEYVAFTLSNKRLLVLLQISGMQRGEVRATGCIDTKEYSFDDICFADRMLVYTVTGKGVFGIAVDEMDGEIPEKELMSDNHLLLSLPDAKTFMVSQAVEKKTLMVVAKKSRHDMLDKIYEIKLSNNEHICREVELDWFFNNHNYVISADNTEGFSISANGEYVAFSGKFLAILKNMGEYYGIIGKPVEAKISCVNANFSNCEINEHYLEFVIKRGAITNNFL